MTYEHPFQDPARPADERARNLTSLLTLEEKIAQMVHNCPPIERFNIPAYNWWNECLHGVARAGRATVFPQAIGLAATFDPDLVHRIATAISDEARAKHHLHAASDDRDMYHGLTYWTPNINIFRDPRWGRGHETYGECPYLTGRIAVAFVKGLQGDDPNHLKLVATPKHFAVHSGPETTRHEFNAVVSEKDLWETYLPAFRDCIIEGKALSVMGAYNRFNGEPCCGSNRLQQEILRDTWGFEGYIVSDCGAICDFHLHHHVTESPEESAALAVKTGCDLNCGETYPALVKAVQQGLLTEQDIDRSLNRLFEARIRLGMFDDPETVTWASIPYDVVDCQAHRDLALEAAQKSIVLLKNQDNLLPLPKDIKTLAVIGPNIDCRDSLLANYNGTPSQMVTPIEGIRAKLSPATRIISLDGCDHVINPHEWMAGPRRDFAEAVYAAQQADAVILCMGLSPRLEGEEGDPNLEHSTGGDRESIRLPGVQHELIETIAKTGKPIILVLISGSALAIPWEAENIPAIIQQFYPGQAGGTALADVLFGDINPSGKLPVTFYRSDNDLPPFENYSMKNRTYRYFNDKPLFPFGHGLSYALFEYGKLQIPPTLPTGPEDTFKVKVDVTNTGQQTGDEIVQVYVSHSNPDVPKKQLVACKRITLKPNECREVAMTVRAKDLCIIGENGQAQPFSKDVQFSVSL